VITHQLGNRRADIPRAGDALIIVDMQIDFLPGGGIGNADGGFNPCAAQSQYPGVRASRVARFSHAGLASARALLVSCPRRPLAAQLKSLGCTRVVLGGLATDYCVLATALDARAAGFNVVVLEDAVRGVDARPGASARALQQMAAAGVHLASAERSFAADDGSSRRRARLG
jgi:nicotinamidase-related amidase